MKKFLLQIFIFGIIFIAVNLLVYRYVTNDLIFQDYQIPKQKLEKFDKFIFSDSHGWVITKNSFRAKNKLNSFGIHNFSYGSDSYIDILYKIEYLLENKIEIDTLFISVDDHMLSQYRKRFNNKKRSIIYAGYSSYVDYYSINNRLEFFYKKYLARYFPLLDPNNSLLLRHYLISFLMSENETNQDEENLSWQERSQVYRLAQSRKRANQHFQSDTLAPSLKEALELILKVSQKNNFELIGLKFPVSPVYRKIVDNEGYGVDKILKQKGYEVLDFKKMFESEKYFSDQDHLNEEGSIIFIDTLISTLRNKRE